MFPDQDYASSRGSFAFPVEPPTVDPDASPTLTLAVSCAWLPYIRGALYQLLLQATWKTDVVSLDLTQARVFNLIDLFVECAEADLPFSCPYDWTGSSQQGWVNEVESDHTPTTEGVFTSGTGWESSSRTSPSGQVQHGVDIVRTFPVAILINDASVDFDYSPGTFDGTNGTLACRVFFFNGGTLVFTKTVDAAVLATGHNHITMSPAMTCDKVEIDIFSTASFSPTTLGSVLVNAFEASGTGAATCE